MVVFTLLDTNDHVRSPSGLLMVSSFRSCSVSKSLKYGNSYPPTFITESEVVELEPKLLETVWVTEKYPELVENAIWGFWELALVPLVKLQPVAGLILHV